MLGRPATASPARCAPCTPGRRTRPSKLVFARRDGARYDRDDVLQTTTSPRPLPRPSGRRVLAESPRCSTTTRPTAGSSPTTGSCRPGRLAVPNPRRRSPSTWSTCWSSTATNQAAPRRRGGLVIRSRCSAASPSSPASLAVGAHGPCRSTRPPGRGGGGGAAPLVGAGAVGGVAHSPSWSPLAGGGRGRAWPSSCSAARARHGPPDRGRRITEGAHDLGRDAAGRGQHARGIGRARLPASAPDLVQRARVARRLPTTARPGARRPGRRPRPRSATWS